LSQQEKSLIANSENRLNMLGEVKIMSISDPKQLCIKYY